MSIEEILAETRSVPSCVPITFTEEECETLYDDGQLCVYLPHTKEAANMLGAVGYFSGNVRKIFIIKLRNKMYIFRPRNYKYIFVCMCNTRECGCDTNDLGEEYDDAILSIPQMRVEYISYLLFNYVWRLKNDEHRVKSILQRVHPLTLNEVLCTRVFDYHSYDVFDDIESETCTLLLDAGANANIRDEHGWNALYYYNTVDATRILLAAGADANISNYDGKSLLASGGHSDNFPRKTVQLLLQAQTKYDRDALDALLFLAITCGDEEYIKMLLNAGADPTIEKDGYTALQYLKHCHRNDKRYAKLKACFT